MRSVVWVKIVCFSLLLIGCASSESSIQYVTDTLYVAKHTKDSIYIKDSIYVTEKQTKDTVYITKHHHHTKVQMIVNTDTIHHHTTDSVSIVTRVEPSMVERAKSASLWLMIGMVASIILMLIIRKI